MGPKRIPVFYYFQTDSGDDNRHPNVFEVNIESGTDKSQLNFDILSSQFPLRQTGKFHWRFRKTIPGHSGYVWQDVADSKEPLPLYGGNVFAKILRLDCLKCSNAPLKPRRIGISRRQAKMKTPVSNGPRSSQHLDSNSGRNAAKSSQRQRDKGNTTKKQLGQTHDSKEELFDMLSGGTGNGTAVQSSMSIPSQFAAKKIVDDLPPHMKGASAEERASARIKKRQKEELDAQRKKVEEKREAETAEMNMRNNRDLVAKQLGPKLQKWSNPDGSIKNIRALLCTMHTVLWDGAKWTPVSVLVRPADVKKAYRKAMLVVHPDKIKTGSAEVQYIGQHIFENLNKQYKDFAEKEMRS